VVIVLVEYGSMAAGHNIITLNESLYGFAGQSVHASRIAAGDWLLLNYDQGLILSDVFNNDATTFYSRIPFRDWVNNGNPQMYAQAIQKPQDVVDWVFVRQGDEISQTFTSDTLKADGFFPVYAQADVTIYKKGAPPIAIPPVISNPVVAEPAVPVPSSIMHIVQRGESVWSIAHKYSTDPSFWIHIAKDNHLTDPGIIRPGELLIINY